MGTEARRTMRHCTAFFVARMFLAFMSVSGLAIQAQSVPSPAPQGAPAGLPVFDVATVKPGDPSLMMIRWMFLPDGVSLTNVPLHIILCRSFGVEEDRIVGIPDWIKEQRFDIEAKVEAEDAPKFQKLDGHQRFSMLIPLFEDRFNLKFHHETRVLPVYVLTVAKGGSKLEEVKPTDPDGKDGAQKHGGWRIGSGQMDADGITIESLIGGLAPQVNRTILDKTGLAGHYNFKLRWTPDDAPPAMATAGVDSPKSDTMHAEEPVAPTLFTALQEQLGLKLESEKAPTDVVVIDHIEKPSPN
jgi:uncharacterized protein (TIGR03435 family)